MIKIQYIHILNSQIINQNIIPKAFPYIFSFADFLLFYRSKALFEVLVNEYISQCLKTICLLREAGGPEPSGSPPFSGELKSV